MSFMRDLLSERTRIRQVRQPKNKNYTPAFRRSILERDNWTCQQCGLQMRDQMTIHHIKPQSTHPELARKASNCITLCRACHQKLHREE